MKPFIISHYFKYKFLLYLSAYSKERLSIISNLNYKNTLKIGTVHSLYSEYIKNVAKKFMKLKPNTSIEIIINHTHNLIEMLSYNLIDIGFVFTLPKSSKFKKEAVDCFVELLSEKIQENML